MQNPSKLYYSNQGLGIGGWRRRREGEMRGVRTTEVQLLISIEFNAMVAAKE